MQQPRAYRRIPSAAAESGPRTDRATEFDSPTWAPGAAAASPHGRDPSPYTAAGPSRPAGHTASFPHAAMEIRRRVYAALGAHPDPAAAQRLELLYHASLAAAGAGCATRWWGPRPVEQVFLRILGRS